MQSETLGYEFFKTPRSYSTHILHSCQALTYSLECLIISKDTEKRMEIMDSVIDQRYRLDLIKYRLEEFEERPGKAVFYCPLCQFNRPRGKYVQKKGGMFWVSQWNAWRFNCKKCLSMTSMYRYLEMVNPDLARRYQHDRWQSGTTGWGHDCPTPKRIIGLATTLAS